MSLNLSINRPNPIKENKFINKFMKELAECLKKDKISLIEDILKNNLLTTANKNAITWKGNEIIEQYMINTSRTETKYFIKDNKKTYWLDNKKHYNNEFYEVLKVENNKIEKIEIKKQEIPNNIGVNDVFRIKNGKCIIDDIATKELKEEITKMAEEVVEKQNKNLERYRKDGHLYMVIEELENNRFLKDLSDSSKIEFEEVNITQDLLDKATEGIVLKYNNGKYEYYSDDGYKLE